MNHPGSNAPSSQPALGVALVLLAIGLAGCGASAPTEVRQKIATFHELANAGRFADLRRDHTPTQSDWEAYMNRRAQLGRMIRTTEASVEDITANYRLVRVHNNTEFERGRALETFNYRIDNDGIRLIGYSYQIGKELWCPALTIFSSQCSVEDGRP